MVAKAIEIQTPTPGFAVQVYAANTIDTVARLRRLHDARRNGAGRDRSVQSTYVHDRERIQLRLGGQRFRYYLIWITTLPPNMQSASIAELTLFR